MQELQGSQEACEATISYQTSQVELSIKGLFPWLS